MTGDDGLVEALTHDWRSAELSEREHAILNYTEKLTAEPARLTAVDADRLREHGLSDKEILAVVMLAGFFQLATRIADALGVDLDQQLTRGSHQYEAFMRQHPERST